MVVGLDAAPRVDDSVARNFGVVAVVGEDRCPVGDVLKVVVGDLTETRARSARRAHRDAELEDVLDHAVADDRAITSDRDAFVSVRIRTVGSERRSRQRVVAVDHQAVEDDARDRGRNGDDIRDIVVAGHHACW